MATIGSRELLLLIIGLDEQGESFGDIRGITRLQKYLFLLEEEEGIMPSGVGFEFEAYKAGPYSARIYDDLELLENLGLIRSEATAESSRPETADISRLSFDDLLESGGKALDSFVERRFSLTELGQKRMRLIINSGAYDPITRGISKIKSKYSYYSLRDLLRHVYQRYPSMTTESEIIDEVMGR